MVGGTRKEAAIFEIVANEEPLERYLILLSGKQFELDAFVRCTNKPADYDRTTGFIRQRTTPSGGDLVIPQLLSRVLRGVGGGHRGGLGEKERVRGNAMQT